MFAEWHLLRPAWLLMLLPLAWLVWRLLQPPGQTTRRETTIWRDRVDPHLLNHLLLESGGRGAIGVWLLAIAWLLLVLALAGPTWQRLPQSMFQAQQYRVILLDLSPSMADTAATPSVLERARFEILDLLRLADQGDIALMAYGPEPFIVSPLTSDVATMTAQVSHLTPDLIPFPGPRRLAPALQEAGDLLAQAGATRGQVILLTDRLVDVDAAYQSAQQLLQRGFRLSVLGLQATNESRSPAQGLQVLANAGGGHYYLAELGDQDSRAVLAGLAPGEPLRQQQDPSLVGGDQWREEGPWLLLIVLPLAALAFRRGWLAPPLLLLVVLPPPAEAGFFSDWWSTPDQRAMQTLQQGDPAAAALQFERQDWQAAAYYQAGQYAQALQRLEDLPGSDAAYNRGNTLARLGRYEEALDAYRESLSLQPQDQDAQYNHDLIQALLQQSNQDSAAIADDVPPEQSPEQSNAEMQAEPDQSQSQSQSPSPDSEQGDEQNAEQGEGQPQTGQGDGQAQPDALGGEDPGEASAAVQGEPDSQAEPVDEGVAEQPAQTGDTSGVDQDAVPSTSADASPRADSNVSESASSEDQQQQQKQQQTPIDQGAVEASDSESQAPSQQVDRNATAPGVEDLLQQGAVGQLSEQGVPIQSHREQAQWMEHMIRSVEDDPAGLLKQRFLLQHLRRNGQLP